MPDDAGWQDEAEVLRVSRPEEVAKREFLDRIVTAAQLVVIDFDATERSCDEFRCDAVVSLTAPSDDLVYCYDHAKDHTDA